MTKDTVYDHRNDIIDDQNFRASLIPSDFMLYGRYPHVGDEKIIGVAPGTNRIYDGGFTNMLIGAFTKIFAQCLPW